jgi:hypothetical protein
MAFNLGQYLAKRGSQPASGTMGILGVAVGKLPCDIKPTDVVVVLNGGEFVEERYTPKSGKNMGKRMVRPTLASTGFGAHPVDLDGLTVPLRISLALPAVEDDVPAPRGRRS